VRIPLHVNSLASHLPLDVHRNKLEGILYNSLVRTVSHGERIGEFDAYTHLWVAAEATSRWAPSSLERGMLVASKGLRGEWIGPKSDTYRCYNELGSNCPVASTDLGCGTLMRILKGKKAAGTKHEQNVIFGLIYESIPGCDDTFGFTLRTLPSIRPFLTDYNLSVDWTCCKWKPVVMDPSVGYTFGHGMGFIDINSNKYVASASERASGLDKQGYPRTEWKLSSTNRGSEWGHWDSGVYVYWDEMEAMERRLARDYACPNVSTAVRQAQKCSASTLYVPSPTVGRTDRTQLCLPDLRSWLSILA
jgi:hypothetical protein